MRGIAPCIHNLSIIWKQVVYCPIWPFQSHKKGPHYLLNRITWTQGQANILGKRKSLASAKKCNTIPLSSSEEPSYLLSHANLIFTMQITEYSQHIYNCYTALETKLPQTSTSIQNNDGPSNVHNKCQRCLYKDCYCCMYVCVYACTYVHTDVCMHPCMYVCELETNRGPMRVSKHMSVTHRSYRSHIQYNRFTTWFQASDAR